MESECVLKILIGDEGEQRKEVTDYDGYEGDGIERMMIIFTTYFNEDDVELTTFHRARIEELEDRIIINISIIRLGGEEVDYHLGNELAKANGTNLIIERSNKYLKTWRTKDDVRYGACIEVHPTNDRLIKFTLNKIERKMLSRREKKVTLKYRVDLNDPQVEKINKRKIRDERAVLEHRPG
jgi:hypothetical protein